MGKRPYLSVDQRRRQLLDAAARLFARDGYAGMTMVALAAEAGVSRRLVYDHFPDLASLYEGFFEDRAARYLAAIDEAIAVADGPVARFVAAFAQLLDMPADDQRAVRLLLADPAMADLAPLRARFRRHIEERWLDDPPADARAVLWALTNGLLALAELTATGEIDREVALEAGTEFATALAGRLRADHPTPDPRRELHGHLAHP